MKDIPSGPSPKIRIPFHVPSRCGVRMGLSAQVCGLISSPSAGDSGFSPRPSASVANSPSSVTSSVLKALNIIYMVSPLPSISPLKSSHPNPRLVNTTQLPLS